MPQASSDRIAPTGHYTAYTWHVLGLPYAHWFATPLGARLYRAYRVAELPQRLLGGGGSKLGRTLENRHRSIDAALSAEQPDCVVELGAGLSRRGVTWALDHGTRSVEFDLPAMVAFKRRLIERHASEAQRQQLAQRWTLRSADILSDGFAQTLAHEIGSAQRPVVVMEGVLGYFGPEHQRQLLGAVVQALAGRGTLLGDLRVRSGRRDGTGLLRTAILVATRGRGASPSFESHAQVRALFAEAGFAQVEILPPRFEDVLSCVARARP